MNKLYLFLFLGWLTLTTQAQQVSESKQQKKKQELVSAKKDQIAKKWYLKRKEYQDEKETEQNKSTGVLPGSTFDFRRNGDFEALLKAVEMIGNFTSTASTEYGTWMFGKGNTSLIITSGGQTRTWEIKSISTTELILINTKNQSLWIFSDKE